MPVDFAAPLQMLKLAVAAALRSQRQQLEHGQKTVELMPKAAVTLAGGEAGAVLDAQRGVVAAALGHWVRYWVDMREDSERTALEFVQLMNRHFDATVVSAMPFGRSDSRRTRFSRRHGDA